MPSVRDIINSCTQELTTKLALAIFPQNLERLMSTACPEHALCSKKQINIFFLFCGVVKNKLPVIFLLYMCFDHFGHTAGW